MRRKRERQRTRTVRAKEPAVRKTTAPQKPKKEHRGLKRFRNGVLVVIFISILTVFGIGVGMYISVEKEIRDMNVQNLAINYSSLVYYTDADGNSYELEQLFNNGNRVWIDSSEIPNVLKEAIVSIEDERFYNHGGVDIKRSAGAFLGWVKEQLGLELDKKKMVVNDGIKALGTYEVPIKLHPKVMGTLRVKVTEQ